MNIPYTMNLKRLKQTLQLRIFCHPKAEVLVLYLKISIMQQIISDSEVYF